MKHAIEVEYAEGGNVTYYAESKQSADDFAERVFESGPQALSAVVRPAHVSEVNVLEQPDDDSPDTQCAQIMSHLKQNGSITTWEAIQEFGITRLASRIYELRSHGHTINSSMTKNKNGKRYAIYRLKGD